MNHPSIFNPTKKDWEVLVDQLGSECVAAIDAGNPAKAKKLNTLIGTIYAKVFNQKFDFCFDDSPIDL